ncbi:hypothetical protein ONZ45_g15337 [Pleurotus djamor]|nr:hypothetical protein ONZ45_g15337 [Pleurotus djamor]
MSVIEELPCNVATDSSLLLGPFPLQISPQLVVYYAEYRFIQALQYLYALNSSSVLNTVLVRELEYVLAFVGWNHAKGCYLTVGPATSALARGVHLCRNPETDEHTLLISLIARTACATAPPQQHAIAWWSDPQVATAAIADVDLPSSLDRLSSQTAYFCVATWFYSLDATLSLENLRRSPWSTQEMILIITSTGSSDCGAGVQSESLKCGRCASTRLALSELAAESLIIEHHVANSAVALARSADGYYRLVQWLQTHRPDTPSIDSPASPNPLPATIKSLLERRSADSDNRIEPHPLSQLMADIACANLSSTTAAAPGWSSSPVPTLDEVIACLHSREEECYSSRKELPESPIEGHDAPEPRPHGTKSFYWPSCGLLSASLYPVLNATGDDINELPCHNPKRQGNYPLYVSSPPFPTDPTPTASRGQSAGHEIRHEYPLYASSPSTEPPVLANRAHPIMLNDRHIIVSITTASSDKPMTD